jgi:excinuclease Cho
MRKSRQRTHPEFDARLGYQYPEHLRSAIQDLPSTPGVYIFHGAEGDLPLYIGKSINIRNRVLSHLRTEDEARMLRQTKRISCIPTVGEIGALLLEAQLIKQQHPLFNQKLRRTKQMCSLILREQRPEVVYSKEVNFATQPGLFGLYGSKRSAIESLRKIADQHRLCLGILGLEKTTNHSPCFRAMLKRCAGACCGEESLDAHHKRLLGALEEQRVVCWPYPGAIGLIERNEHEMQIHVIHHWLYLGSTKTLTQAKRLNTVAPDFDSDGYKILCKPLLSGDVEIVRL